MLTSKVSKYNNRNDNIIITISISNSSNPSIVHQILQNDCNDKLSLITESVAVTQIDIHTAREKNMTNTSYA
jgi:hypothetical protein